MCAEAAQPPMPFLSARSLFFSLTRVFVSLRAVGASLVTKVAVPTPDEAKLVGDRMLLSFIWPAQNPDLMKINEMGTTINLHLQKIEKLWKRFWRILERLMEN